MSKLGRRFNDRELAGKVRDITNRLALKVLEDFEKGKAEDVQFAKDVMLRCLHSSLPRINEMSGIDGEPMKVEIKRANGEDNNSAI